MGSAAAMHAARRGLRVLAIDRASVPNAESSHHGVTRFFRMSSFEHPAYVPLLERAWEAWDALARESGEALFERTGMLLGGPPDATAVIGSVGSALTRGFEHEVLGASEVRRRFPMFRMPDDYRAIWEPGAGCLACERAIRAMASASHARGTTILEHTRVRGWRASARGVTVVCDDAEHDAGSLIITAGPWMQDLLGRDLGLALTVTRQPLHWVEPPRRHPATPPEFPVWAFQDDFDFIYGFPVVHADRGCKVCRHQEGEGVDPEELDREVCESAFEPVRAFLRRMVPSLDTPLQRSAVCMYTNSPDGVFIVDRHPEHENVSFACGFTGHGFKFSPVIGQALVELLSRWETEVPIGPFGLHRFGAG